MLQDILNYILGFNFFFIFLLICLRCERISSEMIKVYFFNFSIFFIEFRVAISWPPWWQCQAINQWKKYFLQNYWCLLGFRYVYIYYLYHILGHILSINHKQINDICVKSNENRKIIYLFLFFYLQYFIRVYNFFLWYR